MRITRKVWQPDTWYKWFAWFPVFVSYEDANVMLWLVEVERKRNWYNDWTYREIQ